MSIKCEVYHSIYSVLRLADLMCVSLCADIEEKGVRMKLTVIDTPGFGDQINNENWYTAILLHCVDLNSKI